MNSDGCHRNYEKNPSRLNPPETERSLVEAVGIEPTSESLRLQNLHAYPLSFLSSNQANKSGNNTCLNVPQIFSQLPPEGNRIAENPAKATSYPFRGLSEFDGCALITQRVVTVRWQLFLFTTVLRGCGTSACIYSLNYSRRSQSPPNYLSSIPSGTTQLQSIHPSTLSLT